DALARLAVRVQVVESFGGAAATLVPRRCVAAVEADVGGRARQGGHGGNEILRAFDPRSVDDHVRRAKLLEEAQCLLAMLVVQPACVSELDEHLVVPDLLASPAEIVERAILVNDVGRELEQDPAQLSRRPQRLECSEKSAKHPAAKLP